MSDQETELVLMPNEYCYYLDKTKGNMHVAVGPFKQSLSQTDQLMEWSDEKKGFVKVDYSRAKRNSIVIPEGWYAPLKNPASRQEHPQQKSISDMGDAGLNVGKKVNVSGPANFALWPGQMCKVIEGHKLRSNQYLLVRIYDVEAFKKELYKAKIKADESSDGETDGTDETSRARETSVYDGLIEDSLATGQQFIIKGTRVHFYIPPDGIEVVPFSDAPGDGGYVHNAVTLEQLQYCILQDEDGKKRYVRGPDVVFPEPTEKFLSSKGGHGMAAKKFTAVELNETSGIYVEVIKEYMENGVTYREGDELFVTGRDQKIYFPREEHAVIKYGDQDRHYAVALPRGEGRYVLNRIGGDVEAVMGPAMFLPDPRTQVIVKRVLSDRESDLLFPGNLDVKHYNDGLRRSEKEISGTGNIRYRAKGSRSAFLSEPATFACMTSSDDGFSTGMLGEKVEQGVMGDVFDRQGQYVPPRTITLESKYDGVVAFDVWNGYAALVTSRSGDRRVIEGPKRVYLEYDETPEAVTLSTGTPKNHDETKETAFLCIRNNSVSDIFGVETSDLCQASIKVSMKVDFVGDTDEEKIKWFSVNNYIRLLSERVSSMLSNHIRKIPVMDFYNDSTNIVRDIILGEKEEGERRGLVFEDNGMVVSEVEVLEVSLFDGRLADRLKESARDALDKAIRLAEKERYVSHYGQMSKLDSEQMTLKSELEELSILLQRNESKIRSEAEKAEAEEREAVARANIASDQVRKDAETAWRLSEIETEKAAAVVVLDVKKAEMAAEADKVRSIMESISPNLTAALQSLGDNDRIAKVTAAIAPQNIFGKEGMLELLKTQFESMGMSSLWKRLGIRTESGRLPESTCESVAAAVDKSTRKKK